MAKWTGAPCRIHTCGQNRACITRKDRSRNCWQASGKSSCTSPSSAPTIISSLWEATPCWPCRWWHASASSWAWSCRCARSLRRPLWPPSASACNSNCELSRRSSPPLHLDLSGLSPQERESELRRLARAEIHRPFDLVRGPLWRLRLLRLEAEDWVLLLMMHHIITDGWSMQVLLHELTQPTRAKTPGRLLDWPALPIQYADYALWQRQWLQGARLEGQLAYWRKQLAGLEPLQLPTDHGRPSVQSYRGAQQVLHLSAAVQQRLQALSRQEGVTLFMTLLAGWLLVLQRYSGQSDVAVGTPIANRSQTELEGLLGFFVNTLVLRCQLEGQASVRELLAHVREVTLGAYSHQEVPFEQVVEALQPERELNRSPLFQVMFAGQQEVLPQQGWEGITLQGEDPELELDIAKFDLTLEVAESEQGIEAALEYNTDLFEPATVKRMLMHWQQALQALVQQPDQPLATLPLLTEAEQALLERWNATQRVYPQERCVHELFAQQAQRQPDSIALLQGEASLSYGELDRRANQVAHSLRQLGVGPEVLVGLCMERSLEMVVGLLGILKAGGAYVPLDPAYPPARLAFMVQDAQVAVLLTQEASVQGLPPHHLPVIALDRDWKMISQQPTYPLPSGTSAEHLAYVMYTSGSTGQPKGVEICHRSITRLLFGVEYARLDGSRRLLHMAPISFDASTFELWGALLHGARCILLPERLPTASRIGSLIQQQQVTTTWLTASLFNAILDEAPESLRGLQQLLTGGEALSVGHIRRALQELPGTELINGYGPTESTTFTCCHPIERELSPATRSIPIGQPISNTQVYLLDAHLQPVPLGIAGELYLGGDGLARGYLTRPELTAERFVPHPCSQRPGARLYKTGDLARYLPDGSLEFVGRLDHQVKLRGYRIELGEIEQALLHHPAVSECVVVVRQSQAGSKQLVAYVVAAQDQEAVEQATLRSFLGERLPEYMVPSHIMVLDVLPLTANGKVDRRALPAPEPLADTREPYAAPRTSIEQSLMEIWSQVLRLPQVGIHDNFFALGGDSILSLSLIAQARRAGLQLPAKQLFQAPTIAQLSQLVTPLASPVATVEPEGGRSEGP